MAQTPKGRLVKGPYEPICRDCAIYFSSTVQGFVFFCRLHLVPAGTGHNFRSKVCYYACNPWVCHHFSEKLKGKSKRKQLLASMLICSKYKNANPPILKKTFFATDASLTPKFTPSGGPLQRQSEHQRCPPKHPLHRPVLYLKNGGHFLFKEGAPTVDGRNPAPVDMDHLRLLIGFYLSQVVSRISSINRISYTKRP